MSLFAGGGQHDRSRGGLTLGLLAMLAANAMRLTIFGMWGIYEPVPEALRPSGAFDRGGKTACLTAAPLTDRRASTKA